MNIKSVVGRLFAELVYRESAYALNPISLPFAPNVNPKVIIPLAYQSVYLAAPR